MTRVVSVGLAVVVYGLAGRAFAQSNECLIQFQGLDESFADGGTLKCSDCDPSCDADGVATKNNACTFHLAVCDNVEVAGCDPGDVKKIKIKGTKIRPLKFQPNGTASVCGPSVDYVVKLRKRGKKKGTARIRASARTGPPMRADADTLILECDPQPAATCPTSSTSTSTTTTPTSTTTTTTGACEATQTCAPEQFVLNSTGHCSTTTATKCLGDPDCPGGETCLTDGILQVSTLAPFPFPLGVLTTLDVGPAVSTGADRTICKHDVIIPAGGFVVPVFCIPALGFTSQVQYPGCAAGNAEGRGTLWDGHAACADADVSKVGDTLDGVCDNTTPFNCNAPGSDPASAGNNSRGDVDATRGNGQCDPPGVQTQLDIPGRSVTWNDDGGECPDSDGVFDAGTDTLITDFSFILSPTTATANGDFIDKNGDSCSFAGNGPDHAKHCSLDASRPCSSNSHCNNPAVGPCVDGPTVGVPAAGPCCTVGQTSTVVSVGLAFSGGAPLYDLIFSSTIPSRITACNPAQPLGTCTLTADPCQD